MSVRAVTRLSPQTLGQEVVGVDDRSTDSTDQMAQRDGRAPSRVEAR
jgi:hypothetical protein